MADLYKQIDEKRRNTGKEVYAKQMEREANRDLYNISVPDELYAQWNKAIAGADDPEETAHKFGTALRYSDMFGVNFEDALANIDTYNDLLWGHDENRTYKSNWKAVCDSWKTGQNSMRQAKLGNLMKQAIKDGDEELQQTIWNEWNALNDENETLSDTQPRFWAIEALKAGAQSTPYTAASGAANMFGQLVGTGLLKSKTAGELLGSLGTVAASTWITGGQEYMELLNEGIRPEIAGPTSLVSGVFQGGVEAVLGESVSWAASAAYATIGKSVGKGVSKSLINSIVNSAQKKWHFGNGVKLTAATVLRYFADIPSEGLEEGAQGKISSMAQNVAIRSENTARRKDAAEEEAKRIEELDYNTGKLADEAIEIIKQEIANRDEFAQLPLDSYGWNDAWNDIKGGMLGAIVLGIPSTGLNIVGDARQLHEIKKAAQNIASEKVFTNEMMKERTTENGDTYTYADVLGVEDTQDLKNTLHDIYEAQSPVRNETNFAKLSDITEINTAEEGYAEAEEDPETGETIVTPVSRTDTGTIAAEDIEVAVNENGTVQRQYRIGDTTKENKNLYGYIDYTVDEKNKTITIDKFSMDYNREGIRQEVYDQFAEKAAGYDIIWNAKSKRAKAVKEYLTNYNPSGKKSGLTYYKNENDLLDRNTRKSVAKQIKENIPSIAGDNQQVAAAVAYAEAIAKNRGESLNDWINRTFAAGKVFGSAEEFKQAAEAQGESVENKRGGQQWKKFGNEVKAVIYAGEKADFSTWIHELSHVWQQQLSRDAEAGNQEAAKQLAQMEKAFNVINHDWNNSQFTFADGTIGNSTEALAYGAEQYLMSGKANNGDLKELYSSLAQFISRVYNALKNFINFNQDIIDTYENYLKGDDSMLKLAEEAVVKADKELYYKWANEQQQAQKEAEQQDLNAKKAEQAKQAEYKEVNYTPEELEAQEKKRQEEERNNYWKEKHNNFQERYEEAYANKQFNKEAVMNVEIEKAFPEQFEEAFKDPSKTNYIIEMVPLLNDIYAHGAYANVYDYNIKSELVEAVDVVNDLKDFIKENNIPMDLTKANKEKWNDTAKEFLLYSYDREEARQQEKKEKEIKDNTPKAEDIASEIEKLNQEMMDQDAADMLDSITEYTNEQISQDEIDQLLEGDFQQNYVTDELVNTVKDPNVTIDVKQQAATQIASDEKNANDNNEGVLSFQATKAEIKTAHEYLSTWTNTKEKERIETQLDLHKGTPWYNLVIKTLNLRKDIESVLASHSYEKLSKNSLLWQVPKMLEAIKEGPDGIFNYFLYESDFIGSPSKPLNAVSASFINCSPSADCAHFCYAVKGRGGVANVLANKELVNWCIEHDPVRAGKLIADDYKHMMEYKEGFALRLLDTGDLSEPWLEFIKQMNKEKVSCQIFSKRAELLEQIDQKLNVVCLSIDQSNRELAAKYPNLPVAYVYSGSDEDIKFLEENKGRYELHNGVILPLKIGKKFLTQAQLAKLPAWTGAMLCPIDAGKKAIGDNRQRRNDPHKWNCTACDKFGTGCFFRRAVNDRKGFFEFLDQMTNGEFLKYHETINKYLNEGLKKLGYTDAEIRSVINPLNDLRDKKLAGYDIEGTRGDYQLYGEKSLGENRLQETEGTTKLNSQLLGELGATNLDRAEETSIRLDTLAIAKEMETAGKDQQAIWEATGWERGIDDKWRYEASDFIINDKAKDNFLYKNDKFAAIYLDELIDFDENNDNNLFQAYPRLKSIIVRFVPKALMDPGTRAYFNPQENAIYFPSTDADNLEGIRNTLIHEVQHVIQDEEGFAAGGNPEMFEGKMINVSELEDEIQGHRNNLEGWYRDIKLSEFTQQSIKDMADGKKTLEQHWKDLEAYKANSEYAEQIKLEEDKIAELTDRIQEINENALDGSVEVDGQIYGSPMMAYTSLAGEVEARNVQRRMNMDFDERMNTMIQDTEDIDRDHQIVMFQALKAAAQEAASIQEEEVRKQYEGTENWLKAPNGNKSNLTEKQWLQVRTPNFIKWFGDWQNDPANASKVVDENGEPLIVYRGQDWKENDYVPGDFVSTEELFAEGYGDVEAVFVNSRKPFNGVEDAEQLRDFIKENEEALIEEYDYFFEGDGGYTSADEIMDALKENWWIAYEQSEIVASEISKRGYDSIWIQEDGVDNIWLRGASMKSATINNGNFDAGDSRINFQADKVNSGKVIDISKIFNDSENPEEELKKQRDTMYHSNDWNDFPDIYYSSIYFDAIKNPEFKELHEKAKNGDIEAAAKFIINIIKKSVINEIKNKYPDAIIAPIVAEEASGKNKLPYVYALMFEQKGFKIAEIKQIHKANHTGADKNGRLIRRARFSGEVLPNRTYIILDDQVNMGGSLRDLRDYIETNGGKVVAATTLTAEPDSDKLKPTSEILDRFKKLGGQLDATLRYYGITDNPAGLTNKEAKRVLGLVDSGRTGRIGKRFSGNQKNNSEYPSTPLRRTEELESKLLFQDAYHGSAAVFDTFDAEKYGLSGEGSMSFGWGTYLTNSEAIARDYAERQYYDKVTIKDYYQEEIDRINANIKTKQEIYNDYVTFEDWKKSKEDHIEKIKAVIAKKEASGQDATWNKNILKIAIANANEEKYFEEKENIQKYIESAQKDIQELEEKKAAAENNTDAARTLYTVDIPDNGYIQWDKNVRRPTLDKIKNALFRKLAYEPNEDGDYSYKGVENELRRELDNVFNSEYEGSSLYGTVAAYLGSDKNASEFLHSIGYTGNEYPAGTNFGTSEKDARNFVIFDDFDAKIVNKLNFQTLDSLYKDALMYDTWEEFKDAYEMEAAFDADGTVDHSQVPSGADNNWYKTTWEMAKAIVPDESMNKTMVQLNNETNDTSAVSQDQLFITQFETDPEMLKDFMLRIGELQKIDFNSQEYSRPADAEEKEYFEHIASLQDLINTRLSDVTIATNAKRIANGEEVSKATMRSIMSRIKNNIREYRSLYSQLMDDPQWAVDEADLPRVANAEGLKKYRLVSPNEDLDRKSIDEIRRLSTELENREIREKAKNGTLTMGDEDSRYIKLLEKDNKRLQEDYDGLVKSISDDFQRISDAQTRRLLELHEQLMEAKENYQKHNDEVTRLIDKGLKVTGKYANKVRQLKFTYDDVWNKYDDLYNTIAINDQVKKLLSLQEEKAKLKAEIQKKQDEKAIASEIKKYRVQLVKRTMRRVPFDKVDYEYARTIIAIQRMLEPNLMGGVNRWIGTEGPYLRNIINNIITDPEYKNDVMQYLNNHSKDSAAFIRFKDLLNNTDNMEKFNEWTEKDREAAIGYLPKEDWIRDLNLKKLAKEREDSIDIDINRVIKRKPMRDKEGNVIRNSKNEPIYAVTFDIEVDKEIEALVRDAVGDTMYNNIVNRPFAEWTMEEMEQLSIRINQLYRTGADARNAKKVAEVEAAAKIRMAIENAVKNTGIVINDDDTPEVKAQKEEKINKILGLDNSLKGTSVQQKKENKFNRLLHGYADATVLRVARILDNYKEGENVTELFHKENKCYEQKQKALNERAIKIQKVMQDNNIDFDLLNEQVEVNGRKFTIDDLLYFLAADADYADSEKLVAKGKEPGTLEANDDYAATSRNAVMFGTLLSSNEDQEAKEFWAEMDRQMQLKINNNELTTAEKQLEILGLLEAKPGTAAYIQACKTRYREVIAAAMKVEKEHPELKILREAIAADYAEQYDRLNQVSIEEFNQPVHRTKCYVPLSRQENNGDVNANKVKEDLLASSGSQTQWVDKGMSKRRVNMAPLNQQPIVTGLYKTWNNSAERTEHFIAYAGYVRELNRVYKSYDSKYTRRFIESRYGKGMMNYIDQYINETANPDANNVRTAGDAFIRTLRGKTAPAYLAWKLSAIVKQGCTSPWPYMQFVSPAEYLAASWKMITSKGELYDAVRAKSVFMNNRTMDPMNDLVTEMLENAKNGFDRNLAKVNATGMKGLEWIDWISVAPGWYACYLKKLDELNKNNTEIYENEKLRLLSENTFAEVGTSDYMSIEKIEALANQAMQDEVERLAVEYADQCTRECQPSSRAADIAPLFKNSSEAMKAYLQFQTSLNVIWNNIRYDLPYSVKTKQFGRIIGMVTGYALAGIMMNAVMEGWHNDDDDDKETEKAVKDFIWYSTTQFTDSVPVLGSTLTTASQKLITGKAGYFGGSGTDMTPMVTKFVNATTSTATAIANRDDPEKAKKAWLKAAANFTEGLNMNFGLPVSGLKEVEKLAGIGDGDGQLGVNFGEVYGILKNIEGKENK